MDFLWSRLEELLNISFEVFAFMWEIVKRKRFALQKQQNVCRILTGTNSMNSDLAKSYFMPRDSSDANVLND